MLIYRLLPPVCGLLASPSIGHFATGPCKMLDSIFTSPFFAIGFVFFVRCAAPAFPQVEPQENKGADDGKNDAQGIGVHSQLFG